MRNLKEILIGGRKELELKLRELASITGIDQAIISKIENGQRQPTATQLDLLIDALDFDRSEIRKLWLAEKILKELKAYPDIALDALQLAEPRIEYLASAHALDDIVVSEHVKAKLSVVDKLQKEWHAKRPLDDAHIAKMREYYGLQYTTQSNQIEGNTLTVRETELVVNKGITITGKSVVEHLEAINHSHAVEMIYQMIEGKLAYDRRSLLELHSLILRSIEPRHAGVYREIPVMISGSTHIPPQPYIVPKMMEDYFLHYSKIKSTLHPILLAAEMHERLVSIHPFVDGNGRTSRLVMNLILLKNGYTLTSLKGDYDSRMSYYQALEKVQVDNDPEPFYKLVIEAVEESLRSHLQWTVS